MRKLAYVLGLILILAAPLLAQNAYHLVLLNSALFFSMVVLGYNLIYGYAGILSLAQGAFWGIGAYTSAILTVDLKLPFLAGFIAAALVTTLFGILLGYPTLKLKSHYLTVATIAFAEAVTLILMNFEKLTHGALGIRGIPPVGIGSLQLRSPVGLYYLNLFILGIMMLFTIRLQNSRLGRALQATRDDELAAAASGVNTTYVRVMAFALSALFAGISGSLYAHFFSYISPELFDIFATARFLSMLLVGGAGTVAGPVIGSVFLTYLPEWLRFLKDWYMTIYGAGLVIILAFAPKGFMGLWYRLTNGSKRRQNTRNKVGEGGTLWV